MKKYFTGIYCPPQIPINDRPARNTERAFELLKRAGVDNVFGYFEDRHSISMLEASLKNAEKTNINFYPRLEVFNGFLGIDGAVNHPNVSYSNLSSEQKSMIRKEFTDALKKCEKYSSFAGMYMGDERGFETFPGIGEAQRLFNSLYPDKLFMYNHLNYFTDDQLYFYSTVQIEGEKKKLEGDLSDNAENRFRRYDKFIGHYLDNVDTEYISTDVYPFMPTWQEAPTSIHRSLYEVQSFFADLKCRTGVKPLTHIQIGNWTDDSRMIGKTEISLHMGIAAAYDFDGFIFFPGCFPNDWLMANEGEEGYEKDGKTGLLDSYGNPTDYYEDTKALIEHFGKIGEYLANAKWLGVSTKGIFKGGFNEEEINKLHWNECIYRGGLPINEKHEYNGKTPLISAESQLFIGAFELPDNKKAFLIVNNSIVTDNIISLDDASILGHVRHGKLFTAIPSSLPLSPGESILVIEK